MSVLKPKESGFIKSGFGTPPENGGKNNFFNFYSCHQLTGTTHTIKNQTTTF